MTLGSRCKRMFQAQAAVLLAAHNDLVLTVTFSEHHYAKVENFIMPILNMANRDTKLTLSIPQKEHDERGEK